MSSATARSAVVTGATGGIGSALVRRLLTDGWSVEALGRDSSVLSALGESTGELPGTLHTAAVDLTDAAAVSAWAEGFLGRGGRVDALVHTAGVIHRGSIASTDVQELDRQFDVNVRAPWIVTRELLAGVLEADGYIVVVNSTQGLQSGPDAVAYAASKHALKAFVDGLRAELSNSGVRVCTVFPGRTATTMQREIFAYEGRPWEPDSLLQPDDVAQVITTVLDLPRTAEITDLSLRPAHKLEVKQ